MVEKMLAWVEAEGAEVMVVMAMAAMEGVTVMAGMVVEREAMEKVMVETVVTQVLFAC